MMFDYFLGRITRVLNQGVVLETNSIGYRIAVSRPYQFKIGDEVKMYVEDVLREDGIYLVGFSSLEERKVYLGLNTVKGIGPKSALKILGECDYKELRTAIEANNLFFLRSVKGIGQKGSAQILLDLRGFFDLNQNINVNQYDEVYSALRSLGFKSREIISTLSKINIPDATNEEIIKEALRRLKPYAQRDRK